MFLPAINTCRLTLPPRQSRAHRTAIVTVLLCLAAVNSAIAFQCYVCDSKSDNECVESLALNHNLQPQDCLDITGAKFCIKTTGVYAGEIGTKRFCSANDQGTSCKFVKQPTGNREYRSCVLTCDTENCNGASSLLDFGPWSWTMIARLAIGLITFLGSKPLRSERRLN